MKILFTTVAALAVAQVTATCFCETRWLHNPACTVGFIHDEDETGDDWCWRSRILTRLPCNDVELQGECETARAEIEDWAKGKYGKRDKLLRVMAETKKITWTEYVLTDAAVTEAIESVKIENGLHLECSIGLLTKTLNRNTLSHCYSPELLAICKRAQKGAQAFLDGVIPKLREMQQADNRISESFIDLYEHQFVHQSLDIHCNVTQHHENEINAAPRGLQYSAVLAIAISYGLNRSA